MFSSPFASRRIDLGIDLGTANTRIVDGAGTLLFDEPSLCCLRGPGAGSAFVAGGLEAQRYQAKIAKPLKVVSPLEVGVLSDMAAARELLRFALTRSGIRRRGARLHPAIGVPGDATQAERRALVAAATDAGFLEPVLVAEPLLAARGLDLAIAEPHGRLVVDCGAGATDVAVVSLGGLCVTRTLRAGGLALDRAIADHLHLQHRFQIGPRSAERLKLQLSDALSSGRADSMVRVRGSDLAAGLPRQLDLPASEFRRLWMRFVREVAATVRGALAETPPELARDILDNGVHLTGAAAPTAWLGPAISDLVGVPVRIEEPAEHAVARGLSTLIGETMPA